MLPRQNHQPTKRPQLRQQRQEHHQTQRQEATIQQQQQQQQQEYHLFHDLPSSTAVENVDATIASTSTGNHNSHNNNHSSLLSSSSFSLSVLHNGQREDKAEDEGRETTRTTMITTGSSNRQKCRNMSNKNDIDLTSDNNDLDNLSVVSSRITYLADDYGDYDHYHTLHVNGNIDGAGYSHNNNNNNNINDASLTDGIDIFKVTTFKEKVKTKKTMFHPSMMEENIFTHDPPYPFCDWCQLWLIRIMSHKYYKRSILSCILLIAILLGIVSLLPFRNYDNDQNNTSSPTALYMIEQLLHTLLIVFSIEVFITILCYRKQQQLLHIAATVVATTNSKQQQNQRNHSQLWKGTSTNKGYHSEFNYGKLLLVLYDTVILCVVWYTQQYTLLLFRMVHIFHALRKASSIPTIQYIVQIIECALPKVLFLIFIVVPCIVLLFAILFTNLYNNTIRSNDNTNGDDTNVNSYINSYYDTTSSNHYFNRLDMSILTLYQIMTGGIHWGDIYTDIVVELQQQQTTNNSMSDYHTLFLVPMIFFVYATMYGIVPLLIAIMYDALVTVKHQRLYGHDGYDNDDDVVYNDNKHTNMNMAIPNNNTPTHHFCGPRSNHQLHPLTDSTTSATPTTSACSTAPTTSYQNHNNGVDTTLNSCPDSNKCKQQNRSQQLHANVTMTAASTAANEQQQYSVLEQKIQHLQNTVEQLLLLVAAAQQPNTGNIAPTTELANTHI